MADAGTVSVKGELDAKDMQSQAADAAKGVESEFTKTAGNIGKAFAGLAVAAGAFDFVKEGVQRLGEMEVTTARTNAVLKSTGGIANVTSSSIEDYAHKVQSTIGVQGDLVQSGENVLLKYTGIRNELGKGNDIFNQTRQAMVDLSVATGKDMASSATILGKALSDPEKGMTALKRAGVQLTEQQKEAITTFVKTGDTLNAQKVILDAVNQTVGGSAKAYGETLPAKLAVAQQSFADMRAEVASAFLPAIEFGATAVTFLSEKIQELPGPLSAAVVGAVGLGAGLGAVAGPLNEVINLGGSVASTFKTVDGALAAAGAGGVKTVAVFGLMAAALSGAVLGGLKLAGAFDDLFVSSDKLAINNMPKLVGQFAELKSKGDEVGGTLESDASKAGIVSTEVDKLGRSISDGSVFYDRFEAVAQKNVKTASELRDKLVEQGIAGEGTGIKVSRLNDIIEQNSVKVAASRGVTDGSTESIVAWGVAFTDAETRLKDAKTAVENFQVSVQSSIGMTLEATGANVAYEDQVDKLTESLLVNGNTFDINEAAGRNNTVTLGNLISTSIDAAEKQVQLAAANDGVTGAQNAASFSAHQLVNDILASGASAGVSAGDMINYTGTILGIPADAMTWITNSADSAAALVDYLIGQIGAIPPSKNSTITTTIVTEYVTKTIGGLFGGPNAAHGAIVTGLPKMASGGILTAPTVIAGEAGPEAVVPLGPSATNAKDRDRVMKQAGLFQVVPMASGGIVPPGIGSQDWQNFLNLSNSKKRWEHQLATGNDLQKIQAQLALNQIMGDWMRLVAKPAVATPAATTPKGIAANLAAAHMTTAQNLARSGNTVAGNLSAMRWAQDPGAQLRAIKEVLDRIEQNQRGGGATPPGRSAVGSRR